MRRTVLAAIERSAKPPGQVDRAVARGFACSGSGPACEAHVVLDADVRSGGASNRRRSMRPGRREQTRRSGECPSHARRLPPRSVTSVQRAGATLDQRRGISRGTRGTCARIASPAAGVKAANRVPIRPHDTTTCPLTHSHCVVILKGWPHHEQETLRSHPPSRYLSRLIGAGLVLDTGAGHVETSPLTTKITGTSTLDGVSLRLSSSSCEKQRCRSSGRTIGRIFTHVGFSIRTRR